MVINGLFIIYCVKNSTTNITQRYNETMIYNQKCDPSNCLSPTQAQANSLPTKLFGLSLLGLTSTSYPHIDTGCEVEGDIATGDCGGDEVA